LQRRAGSLRRPRPALPPRRHSRHIEPHTIAIAAAGAAGASGKQQAADGWQAEAGGAGEWLRTGARPRAAPNPAASWPPAQTSNSPPISSPPASTPPKPPPDTPRPPRHRPPLRGLRAARAGMAYDPPGRRGTPSAGAREQ